MIGPDGKVQLRRINIGRDYGTTLEILDGISPADRVVINPADSLEEGQQVNVVQTPANQQPGQSAQPQQKGSGS